MSKMTNKYSPKIGARAVQIILDHAGEHSSRWAVASTSAAKIACTARTLNE